MRKTRVYSPEPVNGPEILLNEPSSRHLLKAMRIRMGDELIIFDGSGCEFTAKAYEVKDNRLRAIITEVARPHTELPHKLALYLAVVKGERFDWAVEKASELGATSIVPLITEYTQVDPSHLKAERWQRLAVAAAEQSGRVIPPRVLKPMTFVKAARQASGRRIIFVPGGRMLTEPFNMDTSVFIGPEGGFSLAETEKASDMFHAGLGPRILRVETAALAALTLITSL